MTELLALQGTEKVLEIGTGSGYQTAVLGRLAAGVHRRTDRQPFATGRKDSGGTGNRHVHYFVGDGSLGWLEHALTRRFWSPVLHRVPSPLLEQLADGGRMVTPVGPRRPDASAGDQKGRRLR